MLVIRMVENMWRSHTTRNLTGMFNLFLNRRFLLSTTCIKIIATPVIFINLNQNN